MNTYEIITQEVIKGLETKGLQWFTPWNKGTLNAPLSYSTKKVYSGINFYILSNAMQTEGWTRPEFLTFNQVRANKGTVIKGSKSNTVVYWNVSYKDKDGNWYRNLKDLEKAGLSKADVEHIFSPKFYRVFNIEQTQGVKELDCVTIDKSIEGTIFEKVESAEYILQGYKNSPKYTYKGTSAYYRPSTDTVNMPKANTFVDTDSYYKTLFHEIVHSTGHESRLNRKGVSGTVASFGSDVYSKEELVAEMGSLFLTSIAGLEPKDNMTNSQAYINGWISKLTEEPKLIMFASSQAEKAVKYILNK